MAMRRPEDDVDPRIDLLLRALDQAYDRRSWHGTNLKGALRGVSAETAAWRPGPERNNVWELALHCAYWKYAVLRKLVSLPRGSFPLAGSNFFPRPGDGDAKGDADEAAWRAERAILDDQHRRLRAAVAALDPAELTRRPGRSKDSYADLIVGVTAHDLHHAGQIQLIKRLATAAQAAPARRD